MKISAVIITMNEERNIARCMKTLGWVDEIIMVDTDSTDKTVEIARQMGAKVFSTNWQGYGRTKQYAVERATGEWVFSIDADEIVTAGLAEEILKAIGDGGACDGYCLPRITSFIGRWIYHSQWYPDYVLRLFRRGRGKFSDALVHEKIMVDGPVGYLKMPLLHYSYPDLATYFRKSVKYNDLGGKEFIQRGRRFGWFLPVVRPMATFYRHFIFHLGFLDGWAGFFIGMLSAHRNYSKYQYLKKLTRSG